MLRAVRKPVVHIVAAEPVKMVVGRAHAAKLFAEAGTGAAASAKFWKGSGSLLAAHPVEHEGQLSVEPFAVNARTLGAL